MTGGMRHLKRHLTLGGEGAEAAEQPQSVPCLPLAGVKEAAMDPPLQPPPWKRASLSASQAAAVARPFLCRSPPPRGSSQRLLTPRVSWSEIVSNSQDSQVCHSQEQSCRSPPPLERLQRSPCTPLRCREPLSPPQRVAWRRRPPSDSSDLGCSSSAPGGGDTCRDQNEGRLEREFCGVTAIGKGQFSTVYRVQNRIDQCLYAVKKTKRISRSMRQTQLREVFALANVSMEAACCPNIVRYFSSWLEDGCLHIQTELCECSLRDRLAQRRRKEAGEARFSETELVQVLRQVSNGLKVLHSCNFVHLDIKPDNILASRGPEGCYKIADLGLAVAAMGSGCDDISEGDCRYLAREVLRGDLSVLPKADVFALGLVCYELATNPRELPCNGEEWHRLRDGLLDVDLLAPLSEPFLALLNRMVHNLPAQRPPCEEIARHPPDVAEDVGIQALHEEMRKQALEARAEAEKHKQLADSYWQEIMLMKRQELLQCGRSPQPAPGCLASSSAAASTSPGFVLRRGMTT